MKAVGRLLWIAAGAAIAFGLWRDLTTPRAPTAPVADANVPPSADAAVDAGVAADVVAGTRTDAAVDAPSDAPEPEDALPLAPLYTVDEALDDALAGPLTFIGTGDWYGLFSIHACAYRNDRVIVVNEYCTGKEMPAFGLTVLSPTRGRTHVYAEAEAPISTVERSAYFSFRVETEPPAADPLSLAFTYAELRAWDERRALARKEVCFVGTDGKGCLADAAAPNVEAWSAAGAAFVAEPGARWRRIVEALRARAPRDRRR